MSRLLSRIRSGFWFLRRPALYRQLGVLLYDRLVLPSETDSMAESEAWCRERSVSAATAIERLTGAPTNGSISTLWPVEYQAALTAEAGCSSQMGGPADLDLLYYLVRRSAARRVIETG